MKCKFIERILSCKCKFIKKCKWYDKDSPVCNKYGGGYYTDGFENRPAGCYRNMQKEDDLKDD